MLSDSASEDNRAYLDAFNQANGANIEEHGSEAGEGNVVGVSEGEQNASDDPKVSRIVVSLACTVSPS